MDLSKHLGQDFCQCLTRAVGAGFAFRGAFSHQTLIGSLRYIQVSRYRYRQSDEMDAMFQM